MKTKISFLLILTILTYSVRSQTLNISTGLNSSGSCGKAGENDQNWTSTFGTNIPSKPFILNGYYQYWQKTPLESTCGCANWITPNNNFNAAIGIYTFERKISVISSVKTLSLNFKVAYDDELTALDLIAPDGQITPLKSLVVRSTSPNGYYLSNEIKQTIDCPKVGDWILRAKVQNITNPIGFVLSGCAVMSGNCVAFDPCCPPFNKEVLKNSMKYIGYGSINDPYNLKFQPSTIFLNQMQMYLNYIHSLEPLQTSLTIEFRLHDQGNGTLPSTAGWGPQKGANEFATWNWNTTGIGAPTGVGFVFAPGTYPMQVGTWYAVTTGMYTNTKISYVPKTCAENTIYFRIQLMNAKMSSGNQNQVLEVSDGINTIMTIPINTNTKEKTIKAGIGRG
jgi:hypothetical protein